MIIFFTLELLWIIFYKRIKLDLGGKLWRALKILRTPKLLLLLRIVQQLEIVRSKQKIATNMKSKFKSHFDPNGSYTGVPESEGEKPIQDVDDL